MSRGYSNCRIITTHGCLLKGNLGSWNGLFSQTWVSIVMLSNTFTWQASLRSGFFFSFPASCWFSISFFGSASPETIFMAHEWQSPRPLQLRILKMWGYMLSLFLMAVSLIVSPFSALIVLFCFLNWSSNTPLFPQNLTIDPYPSNREMHFQRSDRKLSYEQTGFLHHFPLIRRSGNREV